MRYFFIDGLKKPVPEFPHHKDYIYRSGKFFEIKTRSDLVAIKGIGVAIKKMWLQWRYGYPIPFCMLLDPTSACNISCTGCWAAGYEKKSRLSYEKLDEILSDAYKLGIGDILMSGGEPLMRRAEILKLCKKHNKLFFGLFTNGTLIDEDFTRQMAQLGNLTVFVSVEGFREATDFRRGKGTFDKIMTAMDLLKKYDIGFAFSSCYHSGNYSEICSDDFLDFMREKGAWMGWMFNYYPLGRDDDMSLVTSPEQRIYVKQHIEEYVRKHKFPVIDFINYGHLAFGCAAGGNGFIHINASGDVEPCAFFHYSDVNINDMTLREALASPFFRRFRKAGFKADNPFRPCPIMDAPEILRELADWNGAHSTHPGKPENLHQLADRLQPVAEKWKPVADKLFENATEEEKLRFRTFKKLLRYSDK